MSEWKQLDENSWVSASYVYDAIVIHNRTRNTYEVLFEDEKRFLTVSKENALFLLNPTKNEQGMYPKLHYGKK